MRLFNRAPPKEKTHEELCQDALKQASWHQSHVSDDPYLNSHMGHYYSVAATEGRLAGRPEKEVLSYAQLSFSYHSKYLINNNNDNEYADEKSVRELQQLLKDFRFDQAHSDLVAKFAERTERYKGIEGQLRLSMEKMGVNPPETMKGPEMRTA